MTEEQTIQILDLLHTMQEACSELYTSAELENTPLFLQLCADMEAGLSNILNFAKVEDTVGNKKLLPACQSILVSLQRITRHFTVNRKTCLQKIEFELLPLLQEAHLTYYFFQYLSAHPEHLAEYHEKEQKLLCGNAYIDEALETGRFKYEVSFFILAYNKLDYTRQCVESLLANIPEGLNYELILVNHGSSDGTKEYFESVHPHKQLDIAVNGGGQNAVCRVYEGEFTVMVSNDVIVTPHAIENLLACIRSDPKIAWVVPTTPNISNFQTIPASYSSTEELMHFVQKNNRLDPHRWEQRVRLCNPIDIRRNSVFYATSGLCLNGAYHTAHPAHATSFPDDRVSLLLRRNGYKLMLAKDAYCHHFGSVTLKDEIRQQNEQKYYLEGRQEFYKAFQVDPWGTGFCYDPVFFDRVVGEVYGPTNVLGINCGLGSNSLKIKEQLKEYCHNLDVTLYNITSDLRYMQDLAGVSDKAVIIQKLKTFKAFLAGKSFSHIIWEDPFLSTISSSTLLQTIWTALSPGGRLFVKKNSQFNVALNKENKWESLNGVWFVRKKADP